MVKKDNFKNPMSRKKAQEVFFRAKQALINRMTQSQHDDLRVIPVLYQRLIMKVWLGDFLTRNQAIKAKCLDCSNYQREEITRCAVKKCGLYRYRPYQVKEVL